MPAGALPAHGRPGKVVSKPPGAFSSRGRMERRSPGGVGSHTGLCGELVTGDVLLLTRCRRGCRHPPPRLPKGAGSVAAPAAFPGYWSSSRLTPVLLRVSPPEHRAWPCSLEGMRGAGRGAGPQGNQSDPANTRVWLLQDGGVHPHPYSTATASGPTPVPCQNPHGSFSLLLHPPSSTWSRQQPDLLARRKDKPGSWEKNGSGISTSPGPPSQHLCTLRGLRQWAALSFPLEKVEMSCVPAYCRQP